MFLIAGIRKGRNYGTRCHLVADVEKFRKNYDVLCTKEEKVDFVVNSALEVSKRMECSKAMKQWQDMEEGNRLQELVRLRETRWEE